MASEQDMNSTDIRNTANIAAASVAMSRSAKSGPKWLRRIILLFAVITVLATGAGLIDRLAGFGGLPKCDAKRTRDTLSSLNKSNQVNAASYNFIKTVKASADEVTCTANLALRKGGSLEYDYRIYKDAGTVKVQITGWREQ